MSDDENEGRIKPRQTTSAAPPQRISATAAIQNQRQDNAKIWAAFIQVLLQASHEVNGDEYGGLFIEGENEEDETGVTPAAHTPTST